MKWYPLAHLAAVTMSCFSTELQALQLLFPKSASGIARALPSHSCHTSTSLHLEMSAFGVAFRQQLGSISCARIGLEWPNLGELALRHTQRPLTYQDPFFPCHCLKVTEKPTQYSLLQQLLRKTFDG